MNDSEIVRLITDRVLEELRRRERVPAAERRAIPVGVSARHCHLCREDADVLFGEGYQFTPRNELYQTGQFAAEETVTLVGPRNVIQGVRILIPLRKRTQVEISRTDSIHLGILPPVAIQAEPSKAARIVIVAPAGVLDLPSALICSHRHIHLSPEEAREFGVEDGQMVKVHLSGLRALTLENVTIRVSPDFRLQLHLDTDEANAADLSGDVVATIIE